MACTNRKTILARILEYFLYIIHVLMNDQYIIFFGTGRGPLDVVLLYGFDCTSSTPNWYKMDKIFWLVHAKLTHFVDSSLGYVYVMSTPNTYTSDMKLVDSTETEATGYKGSSFWHRASCTKNMASGLTEAHKLISYREHSNGIILLFSDGLINKGDFFDGAEDFVSEVPVHTFTLEGDAYNEVRNLLEEFFFKNHQENCLLY